MLTRRAQTTLTAALLGLAVLVGLASCSPSPFGSPNARIPGATAPGDYLFCFWNLENLFDDQENPKDLPADKEYDHWFSSDREALKLKLQKHADVLMALNGGKGPDIIAVAEVESERAAILLKDALNERLKDPALQYQHVAFREVRVGRHIAPAIITRLPLEGNRTDQLGDKKFRIVKSHIKVAGQELIVIASHWRSRKEQGNDSGDAQRNKYANIIYGNVKGMILSNPTVDVLVCGDFNDDPTDTSVVDHLRATGDMEKVRRSGQDPYLFNLMANKDRAQFGSHYYKGWHIFDQIVVSPGMLDTAGWSCKPETVQTVRQIMSPSGKEINLAMTSKTGQPWRFGDRKSYDGVNANRGYSDHFPVVVTLSVRGN